MDTTLSDEDGPYMELMVGAYSDNQPDYSWLQPYETRSFSMNWYPFRILAASSRPIWTLPPTSKSATAWRR